MTFLRNNTRYLPLLLLFFFSQSLFSQNGDQREIQNRLETFFGNYQARHTNYQLKPKMTSFRVDDSNNTIIINADAKFSEQELTPEIVDDIYDQIRHTLPSPYNRYRVRVMTNGYELSELIPNRFRDNKDRSRTWGRMDYEGNPWVRNVSRPHDITEGLDGRHLAIGASHGKYYDKNKGQWKWQRPNLFCTTEDLFTQTIVIPYLMPMLENAGAVVFSPRERDWQKREVIVDNDGSSAGRYDERNGTHSWSTTEQNGFARHGGTYRDGENPFAAGSARMVESSGKKDVSVATYLPDIPENGRYAVYVSYQTLPNSVDDAHYVVWHKGQPTHFRVNQRMGGSTWVYLGTFDFSKGMDAGNRVELISDSEHGGIVSADAVRFGGGMGNITRGGSTSGMPRCLEGARYFAQWAGAPYSVYRSKEGKDDYGDDINVRSLFTNWIGGGSVFIPNQPGKRVPIELELAVHSDAGYDRTGGNEFIGTLSICTTQYNEGKLDAGISRLASRDLADALLEGAYRDLRYRYKKWYKRVIYDRNYSESRLPAVPSAILETLSHQNFGDMRYGLDPNFRFTLARSIYKTILRYVNEMHGTSYTVQPLQPNSFQVELTGKDKVKLSWSGTRDPQEPTAIASSFNVYCAIDDGGFDNGTNVKGTSCMIDVVPGRLYHFRVTAVNKGGESFPSEVLSACIQPGAQQTVLVVNGFHRLTSPATIDTGDRKGFDLDADPGITYGPTAGWNGRQTCFDNSQRGKEGPGSLGYGGDELAGRFIAGNDFNYVKTHAEAIRSAQSYNIVSCSSESVESGKMKLTDYDCVDLVLGLERNDGRSLVLYQAISNTMQQKLAHYAKQHGSLLVSGSFVGADMTERSQQHFLSTVLKVGYGGSDRGTHGGKVQGLGGDFTFFSRMNETHYAAPTPDILQPQQPGICAMLYGDGRSAAVAYSGNDYRCFTMGFPFECLESSQAQGHVMRGIMNYLLKGKKEKGKGKGKGKK